MMTFLSKAYLRFVLFSVTGFSGAVIYGLATKPEARAILHGGKYGTATALITYIGLALGLWFGARYSFSNLEKQDQRIGTAFRQLFRW